MIGGPCTSTSSAIASGGVPSSNAHARRSSIVRHGRNGSELPWRATRSRIGGWLSNIDVGSCVGHRRLQLAQLVHAPRVVEVGAEALEQRRRAPGHARPATRTSAGSRSRPRRPGRSAATPARVASCPAAATDTSSANRSCVAALRGGDQRVQLRPRRRGQPQRVALPDRQPQRDLRAERHRATPACGRRRSGRARARAPTAARRSTARPPAAARAPGSGVPRRLPHARVRLVDQPDVVRAAGAREHAPARRRAATAPACVARVSGDAGRLRPGPERPEHRPQRRPADGDGANAVRWPRPRRRPGRTAQTRGHAQQRRAGPAPSTKNPASITSASAALIKFPQNAVLLQVSDGDLGARRQLGDVLGHLDQAVRQRERRQQVRTRPADRRHHLAGRRVVRAAPELRLPRGRGERGRDGRPRGRRSDLACSPSTRAARAARTPRTTPARSPGCPAASAPARPRSGPAPCGPPGCIATLVNSHVVAREARP